MSEETINPREITKELEKKAYLKDIGILMVRNKFLIAETSVQDKIIQIGDWVPKELNKNELSGVIAHEIGHIVLEHLIRNVLVQFLFPKRLLLAFFLIVMTLLYVLPPEWTSNFWFTISFGLFLVVFLLTLIVYQLLQEFNAKTEFQADYLSAILNQSPQTMIFGLKKTVEKIEKVVEDEKNRIRRWFYLFRLKRNKIRIIKRMERLSEYLQNQMHS